LHHGGTHQHGRGGVDVGHLVSAKKQQDGEKVDDEFHGKSAGAVDIVTAMFGQEASKSNEAEFMQ
jgi:hypothetical protein